MAVTRIQKVRVRGIASAVPQNLLDKNDILQKFGEDGLKTVESTGFQTRAVSSKLCASDLCYTAAVRLLSDLNWSAEDIDVLIFVSQTPDYVLPATSAVLHGRLGLKKTCLAFDINMGCSGYVYGLAAISKFVTEQTSKALLVVGDTISHLVSEQDRATYPIFGDAGTATALEYDQSASDMVFELGTDGKWTDSLKVPAGGFRKPKTSQTAVLQEQEGGNWRAENHLLMKGADVFTFTLREIPPLIQKILESSQTEQKDVDYFIFHQANKFMLGHLAKKMKVNPQNFVESYDFGNTSCASIPLAVSSELRRKISAGQHKLCLSGFGVGFSWGAVMLDVKELVLPEIMYVQDPE